MAPTLEERVHDHEERIGALESGQLEVIRRIGAPPDGSTGAPGSGMAGTLAAIASDVRELKDRGTWPMRLLKAAGAVLAVAVPIAAAVGWAVKHLHYAP